MHQRFNEVPEFFLYALAAGTIVQFALAVCGESRFHRTRSSVPQPFRTVSVPAPVMCR